MIEERTINTEKSMFSLYERRINTTFQEKLTPHSYMCDQSIIPSERQTMPPKVHYKEIDVFSAQNFTADTNNGSF